MKLDELMKQAQQMQEGLAEAQAAVKDVEVVGEAGAGLVKVRMAGTMMVLAINVDPSVLSEEKAVLEDLIAAAVNDGVRKAQAAAQQKMAAVGAGMGLPAGFKMPF